MPMRPVVRDAQPPRRPRARLAEVGDAHHRELEPLCAVDRHQPHGVERLGLERRLALALLEQVAARRSKSMKPRRSRPSSASYSRAMRISLRTFAMRRSPAGQRQHGAVVARLRDRPVDQRLERHARRRGALGVEALQRKRAPAARSAGGRTSASPPSAPVTPSRSAHMGVLARLARVQGHQGDGVERRGRRAARRAPSRAPARRAGSRAPPASARRSATCCWLQ